jgi:hypothetical protein
VLSDIRHDIDEAIAGIPGVLEIINLEHERTPLGDRQSGPIELMRAGQTVSVRSMLISELKQAVATWRPGQSLLIANLTLSDLRRLRDDLPAQQCLIGYHHSVGYWVMLGEPATRAAHAPFSSPRARPFGMGRLLRAPVAP